ncbi:MAG: thiamine pyrophosphate-binding protein [Clostridia bacterium]|nr:thiamine pyrophosphate-binding protein [Clostridia bacterium]
MKIRLADYVADFLVSHGVTDCFSVVGGGAMHLNDALGHKEGLKVTYNHHEQASAIAAESYARLNNKIAALCVTTGPGGTNAITGVVGGWLDSIPMFVISGQVRYDTTSRYAERFTQGLKLRAVGDQEFDITKAVGCMCKYAAMLEDINDIKYMLEKAWHLAVTGRPGPVWIDIPVNYQGSFIETDDLREYDSSEDDETLPPAVDNSTVKMIIEMLKKASRPVIYAGGGIRLSGGYDCFNKLKNKLGVPVVTYWNSIDVIETDDPLYCGRGGNMGDRAGNFAVQNSDLLLCIGTRLSIRQVGYSFKTWARAAKVIMVDADKAEFKKPTIHVDFPVHADAKEFMSAMLKECETINGTVFRDDKWREQCLLWKKNYPVVSDEKYKENGIGANVYAFIKTLSDTLPDNSLTAVSNGACCVAGHQAWNIKKGTRFIINNAIASMGYGLPAAIGLCIASKEKKTVCLEGDGSIMMNLQELQTIVTNKLPIKIFMINNNGYHSIRITQTNLFGDHTKVGIGPESGDLSFPDFSKIAAAFGLPYFSAHSNSELRKTIEEVFNTEGFAFCEIFTDTKQVWEPKSSTRRLPDGRLVSPPLEDLAPFLPREELHKNMFIDPISED